jgi:hypothetical protein
MVVLKKKATYIEIELETNQPQVRLSNVAVLKSSKTLLHDEMVLKSQLKGY